MNLSNEKSNKLWEVVVFKEFLEEKASPDELYFYLHCRHLLFKGPQLEASNSTFDIINFVNFKYAVEVVRTMLYQFDEINI